MVEASITNDQSVIDLEASTLPLPISLEPTTTVTHHLLGSATRREICENTAPASPSGQPLRARTSLHLIRAKLPEHSQWLDSVCGVEEVNTDPQDLEVRCTIRSQVNHPVPDQPTLTQWHPTPTLMAK
jgi:hypothetical protein